MGKSVIEAFRKRAKKRGYTSVRIFRLDFDKYDVFLFRKTGVYSHHRCNLYHL